MVRTIFNDGRYLLRCGGLLIGGLSLGLGAFHLAIARSQEPPAAWQTEVRKDADAHNFDAALRVIDQQLAKYPNDVDIRNWHARVLSWAGRLSESEKEFVEILKVAGNDPDNWMGLAFVHL